MEIQYYNNEEDFTNSIHGGSQDYIIRLNAAMYTRYSIMFKIKRNKYRIKSHVDDNIQLLTKEEMFSKDYTNFKEALEKNALGKVI